MTSQIAGAECLVRDVSFLPVQIDSAIVNITSFVVEAITNARFNVTATYIFQYEQPQDTEILENFELWLMTRPAPENTTELERTLRRISVLQRSGNLTEPIDIEEAVGNSTVYFQV